MRTLNQQEIAAVNGGLSLTDLVNAINGKPVTGIFASASDKQITSLIASLSPYIKPLINSLIASIFTKKTA